MDSSSKTSLTPHRTEPEWLRTSQGDPRGYIEAGRLTELWLHTGTICNLRCPFCLEGSKPGDNRIEQMTLADVTPYIDEALTLGVEQFSFTGGEPFVTRDMLDILKLALSHRPCLVLTNATEPLMNCYQDLKKLQARPHPLKLRVSLDFPDEKLHDQGRGPGNFSKALETLGRLYRDSFAVSIARQRRPGEDVAGVDRAFAPFLEQVGVPADINIVSFPEFLTPGERADVPEMTEDCMTRHHSEKTRSEFMCHYTRFVLKKGGRMRVYACTLVDDDEGYDLGITLTESLQVRVMLRHHRCYSCFAFGASCSEA